MFVAARTVDVLEEHVLPGLNWKFEGWFAGCACFGLGTAVCVSSTDDAFSAGFANTDWGFVDPPMSRFFDCCVACGLDCIVETIEGFAAARRCTSSRRIVADDVEALFST